MASASLESTAVFESRALAMGLSSVEIGNLVSNGWGSFATFAFAANFVPGSANDSEFVQLCATVCGADPAPPARIPLIRRLYFEAYTLAAADLRQRVDGSHGDAPRKLAAPERALRYREQQLRLPGLVLRDNLDVSHQLLDQVMMMQEDDVLRYVELSSCTKREQELRGVKSEDVLKRAADGSLRLGQVSSPLTTDVTTDLLFKYALMRRALAFDQARILSFSSLEKWSEKLLRAFMTEQPAGYARVSFDQCVRADRALFCRMQELTRGGIRMDLQGVLPCEAALKEASGDTDVMFLLLPLPSGGHAQAGPSSGATGTVAPVSKRALKKQRQATAAAKEASASSGAAAGAKGPGKGKSKKGAGIPAEMVGQNHRNAQNENICFSYNMACGCTGATKGQRCRSGWHVCCRPGCTADHSATDHP